MLAALVARDALVSRDAAALGVALHAQLPSVHPERATLIATELIDAIPIAMQRMGL
jgi:NAD(P)H-hydrate repair Nnr-like enzyme with NAD(P)H-hydrate dehydratase domain